MEFICTNCHYEGKPKSITKGSMLMEILLWLLFFPIGIIYSVWRLGSRSKGCPICKTDAMIPTNTPRGMALIKQAK